MPTQTFFYETTQTGKLCPGNCIMSSYLSYRESNEKEEAKNKNANLGDLEDILYAIKWLGNAGSHGNSEITIDDVFDAYEFMNHILNEIYEPKQKLEKLAKEIRKKKGPVKAKRSV